MTTRPYASQAVTSQKWMGVNIWRPNAEGHSLKNIILARTGAEFTDDK